MAEQNIHHQAAGPDRTVYAAVLAIVMVLVASLPAALVVIVYSYLIRFMVSDSWTLIPYLNQIAVVFFPEVIRGIVTGAIAIATTQYFFKSYNKQAVKLATMCFWTAVVVLLSVMSMSVRGFSIEVIGSAALLVGLAGGLSMDREAP